MEAKASHHMEEAPADSVGDLNITRSSLLDNKRVLALSLLINIGAMELGMDQGTLGGFQAMPGFLQIFGYPDPKLPGGYGINATVQQLLASLSYVGIFVGAILCGVLTTVVHRKGALWIGCIGQIIGTTAHILVTNLAGLYASRVLIGISEGFFLVAVQLYMHEFMPANLRSINFSIWQVNVSFGGIIGAVINNATSTRLSRSAYQIPLGVLYISAFVLGIGLFFVPETPRQLVLMGKHDKARAALRWARDPKYSEIMIEEEIAEIEQMVALDKKMASSISFFDIWRPANLRRTLTAIGVNNLTTGSGQTFVLQYGVYFFLLSGDTHAFRDTIILFVVGMVGGASGTFVSGRFGKRFLFMAAISLQALCMLGMALAYTVRGLDAVGGNTIIAMTIIFYFFNSLVINPFSSQVSGEIPSQPLRGMTLSAGFAVSFIFGWAITFTAPYFINPSQLNWGAKYGYFFLGSNLVCLVFVYFCVPETNKRTLEEISECYQAGISARKFESYRCSTTTRAREEAVVHFRELHHEA